MQNRSRWLLLKVLVTEVLRIIEEAIKRFSSFLALHIFGFELSREEKYYYLTKYYCPKKQNSLFKKHCIKGEAENLRHQL